MTGGGTTGSGMRDRLLLPSPPAPARAGETGQGAAGPLTLLAAMLRVWTPPFEAGDACSSSPSGMEAMEWERLETADAARRAKAIGMREEDGSTGRASSRPDRLTKEREATVEAYDDDEGRRFWNRVRRPSGVAVAAAAAAGAMLPPLTCRTDPRPGVKVVEVRGA